MLLALSAGDGTGGMGVANLGEFNSRSDALRYGGGALAFVGGAALVGGIVALSPLAVRRGSTTFRIVPAPSGFAVAGVF